MSALTQDQLAGAGRKFPELLTRQQAEAQLKQIAHMIGLLGCAVALRDQAVLEVQTRHQAVINSLNEDIQKRTAKIAEWATHNKETEFGESQSLAMPDGTLFFRKGNRKLELLAEWDWDKVLERLLKFDDTSQWASYVKRDPVLDKAKLLLDTKGDTPALPPARLKTIGLIITREERFSIEVRPGPDTFLEQGAA